MRVRLIPLVVHAPRKNKGESERGESERWGESERGGSERWGESGEDVLQRKCMSARILFKAYFGLQYREVERGGREVEVVVVEEKEV
jgi:hypothetical protein